MRRWNPVNINTPSYFNTIWPQWEGASFNNLRMRTMTRSVVDNSVVLDLGAGYLGCGMYLAQRETWNGSIVCVDFSIEAARMTLRDSMGKLQYIVADVLCVPLQEGRFDYVFAGEIIEHMEQPEALLKEMKRMSRPGGQAVVSTVDMHCATAKRNGCRYPDHVWDFTCDSLRDICRTVFDCADVSTCGNYHIGWLQ